MADKRPVNPLDNLKDIVGDLWGSTMSMSRDNARNLEALTRELEKDSGIKVPGATEQPAQPRVSQDPQAYTTPAQPEFPPFETFWRGVDETVDWTDALAHPHPTDGLTSETLWGFFHEHAEKVLAGDLPTYLEVLKAANPLGDLTPYARGFNVHAASADRLTVSFEALPEYLVKEPAEVRRYLAGISLRCARDLMALLPVVSVDITARTGDKTLLTVPLLRGELQKVRFAITDPEQLVLQCGGIFAE